MFVINAELNLQLSKSAGNIANDIQNQFKNLKIKLDVEISPRTKNDVAELSKNIGVLQNAMQALSAESAKAAAGISKYSTAVGQANAGTKSASSVISGNASAIRNITAAYVDAGDAATNFGRQIGLAGKRFGAFVLATGGIFALTRAIKAGLTEAIQFDLAINKLRQVADDGARGVDTLRSRIQQLATTTGVASLELAEAATAFTQAGLNAKDAEVAVIAFSKALLTPNFGNAKQTIEGMIALYQQFGKDVNKLEGQLGSINAVAGAFASEAEDLIKAVQKAGGVFSSTGGKLEELLALMSTIRSTTRESADSIATGLRSIFTYIQRTDTVDHLKQLGVQLRYTREQATALGNVDLTDQFVGPYQAIQRLSEGLSKLRNTDPRYSQIVEDLGGVRQVSRVLPLIQQFAEAQKALNVARIGGASLEAAAAIRQDAVANKITKLRETYQQLTNDLVNNRGFKAFIDGISTAASAVADLIRVLGPLLPAITAFALVKSATFGVRAAGGVLNPSAYQATTFSSPIRRASGGPIPGIGIGDHVPVLAEPGEYVINKRAAKKLGHKKLERLNGYAEGGEFEGTKGTSYSGIPTYGKFTKNIEANKAIITNNPVLNNKSLVHNYPFGLEAKNLVRSISIQKRPQHILSDSGRLLIPSGGYEEAFSLFQQRPYHGNFSEDGLNYYTGRATSNTFQKVTQSGNTEDVQKTLRAYNRKDLIEFISKLTEHETGSKDYRTSNHVSLLKSFQEGHLEAGLIAGDELQDSGFSAHGQLLTHLVREGNKYGRYARGGPVFGGTPGEDSVNARLMPGEFVLKKDSVDKIGVGAIHYMNREGKIPKGHADGTPDLSGKDIESGLKPFPKGNIQNTATGLAKQIEATVSKVSVLFKDVDNAFEKAFQHAQSIIERGFTPGSSSFNLATKKLGPGDAEDAALHGLIRGVKSFDISKSTNQTFEDLLNHITTAIQGNPAKGVIRGTLQAASNSARIKKESLIGIPAGGEIGDYIPSISRRRSRHISDDENFKNRRVRPDEVSKENLLTSNEADLESTIKVDLDAPTREQLRRQIEQRNIQKSIAAQSAAEQAEELAKRYGIKDPNARIPLNTLNSFPLNVLPNDQIGHNVTKLTNQKLTSANLFPNLYGDTEGIAFPKTFGGKLSRANFIASGSGGKPPIIPPVATGGEFNENNDFRFLGSNRNGRQYDTNGNPIPLSLPPHYPNSSILDKSGNVTGISGVSRPILQLLQHLGPIIANKSQTIDDLQAESLKTGRSIRLFRGEGSLSNPEFSPGSPHTGNYFSIHQDEAAKYAKINNGQIHYLDISLEEQKKHGFIRDANTNNGLILSSSQSARKQIYDPSGFNGLNISPEQAFQTSQLGEAQKKYGSAYGVPGDQLEKEKKERFAQQQALISTNNIRFAAREAELQRRDETGTRAKVLAQQAETKEQRRQAQREIGGGAKDFGSNSIPTFLLPSKTNDPLTNFRNQNISSNNNIDNALIGSHLNTINSKTGLPNYVTNPEAFGLGKSNRFIGSIPQNNGNSFRPRPRNSIGAIDSRDGYQDYANFRSNNQIKGLGLDQVGHLLGNQSGIIETLANKELKIANDRLIQGVNRQLQSITPLLTANQRLQLAEELVTKAYETNATIIRNSAGKAVALAGLGQNISDTYQSRTSRFINGPIDEQGRGRFGRITDALQNGDNKISRGAGNLLSGSKNLATKIGNRLYSNGGLTAAYGLTTIAPFAAQALSPDANSLRSQVISAEGESAYSSGTKRAGTLESAAIGAGAGLAFGPLGAAIGGTAGALYGFATSVQKAAADINNAKLDNALESLGDKIRTVSSGKNSLDSVNQEEIIANLNQAKASAEFKAADSTNSIFRKTDPKVYQAARERELKVALAPQAGNLSAVLSEELTRLVKKRSGSSPEDIAKEFNSGTRGEIFKTVNSVRGISQSQGHQELLSDTRDAINNQVALRSIEKGSGAAERVTTSLGRLASAVSSAADSTEHLKSTLDVISGGHGRISGLTEGLNQIGGFGNDFNKSINGISGFLGPEADSFKNSANATDQLKKILPEILAQVASEGIDDKKTQTEKVSELIDHHLNISNSLGSVAGFGAFKDNILSPDQSAIKSIILGGLHDEASKPGGDALKRVRNGDVTQFSNELLSKAENPVKTFGTEITKSITDIFNGLLDNLSVYNRKIEDLGTQQSRSFDLNLNVTRAQADIKSAKLGGGEGGALLSFEQLVAPFQARQQQLLQGLGVGGEDFTKIGSKLSSTNTARERARQDTTNLFLSGNKDAAEKSAREFSRLDSEANRLEKALRNLIDPTQKLAAIQERLSHLNEDRESRLGFAKRFINADAEERGKIIRGQGLVRGLNDNPDRFKILSDDDRRLALKEAESLGAARFPNGRSGTELANLLAGTEGTLKPANEQDRENLLKLRGTTQENALGANDVLTKVLGEQNDKFIKGLDDSFNKFFTNLELNLVKTDFTKAKIAADDANISKGTFSNQKRQADILLSAGIGRGTPEEKNEQLRVARGGIKELNEFFVAKDKINELINTVSDEAILDASKKGGANLKNEREVWEGEVYQGSGVTDVDLKARIAKIVTNAKIPEALQANVITYTAENFHKRYNSKDDRIPFEDRSIGTAYELISESQSKLIANQRHTALKDFDKKDNAVKAFGYDTNNLGSLNLDQREKLREALQGFNGANQSLGELDENIKKNRDSFEKLDKAANDLKDRLEALESLKNKQEADSIIRSKPEAFGALGIYRATGGSVFHPSGTDVVPAMLSHGEYVVNSKSARANARLLEDINDAKGPVTGTSLPAEQRFGQPSVAPGLFDRRNSNHLNIGGMVYLADGGPAEFKGGRPDNDTGPSGGDAKNGPDGVPVFLNPNGTISGIGDSKGPTGGAFRFGAPPGEHLSGKDDGIKNGAYNNPVNISKPKKKPVFIQSPEDIKKQALLGVNPNGDIGLDALHLRFRNQGLDLIKKGRLKEEDLSNFIGKNLLQSNNDRQINSALSQQAFEGTGDEIYQGSIERVRKTEDKDFTRFRDRFGEGFRKLALRNAAKADAIRIARRDALGRKGNGGSGKGNGNYQDAIDRSDIYPDKGAATGGPGQSFQNKGPGVRIAPDYTQGQFKRFATGGIVTGGIPGVDSVPSLLRPGEQVIPSNTGSVPQAASQGQQNGAEQKAKLASALSTFAEPAGKLASALMGFGEKSEALVQALDRFPREVSHSGNFEVNVNHNGAELFSEFSKGVKTMIDSAVTQGLNTELNKRFPEAASKPSADSANLK